MAEQDNFLGEIGDILPVILGASSKSATSNSKKPIPVACIDRVDFSPGQLARQKAWEDYSRYVKGGGTPNKLQFLGGASQKGMLSIIVLRNNYNKVEEIVGYQDMRLYIGDVVTAVPGVINARIQFLLGGRFNLNPGAVIQIKSSKDASIIKADLQYYKDRVNEFSEEPSPIKQTSAGGVMGIRG